MESTTKKYLVFISVILLLIGVIVFLQNKINKLKYTIVDQKSQKTLDDGVVKSGNTKVEPGAIVDAGKNAGIPIDGIKTDADANGEKVTGINTTNSNSSGDKKVNLSSSRTEPRKDIHPTIIEEPPHSAPIDCSKLVKCPDNPDKYGYFINKQILNIHEPFNNLNLPFGDMGFSAWQEKPWSYTIFPRNYESTIVITENEYGKKSAYARFSVKVNEKSYDIPISKSQLIYSDLPSTWNLNPRIMAGMSVGVGIPLSFVWGPSLGVTIGSYGRYISSPDWFFGIISVGYEINQRNIFLSVDPVLYKISNHIPFTNNLYIGPTLGIDMSGNFIGSASLKLAF